MQSEGFERLAQLGWLTGVTRRQWLRHGVMGVAAGALSGAGSLGYAWGVERHRLVVEENRLNLRGLGAGWVGVRVAHLSDLHLEPWTKEAHLVAAVERTNALRPDAVVLTGDFVTDSWQAGDAVAEILSDLRAPQGVWACLGNHDHWNRPNTIAKALARRGVNVLRNEAVVLERFGDRLAIAGTESAWSGRPDVAAAVRAVPGGIPVLLLAHEPDFASLAASTGRIGAQLSGHTHGGQVRFGPWAPVLVNMGRQYVMGAYRVGSMSLYVNRGLGCVGIPLRFGAPPEITVHTLAAA
ncbi:MAG: metallophosphoesterase [Verrucomicrobiales bacterium]